MDVKCRFLDIVQCLFVLKREHGGQLLRQPQLERRQEEKQKRPRR